MDPSEFDRQGPHEYSQYPPGVAPQILLRPLVYGSGPVGPPPFWIRQPHAWYMPPPPCTHHPRFLQIRHSEVGWDTAGDHV